MRDKKDLRKLLNLNYLDLTNKTVCAGKYDMPKVYCNPAELPDYIALYSQPCEYHKTANTCVSFYDYDIKFDNDNGLYNAIRYKKESRLNEYRRRFEGVKFFISPDYSQLGDVPYYHNIHRLGRAREVSLWLSLNVGASVIPNIPCCCDEDLEFVCDGLEDVSIVAFSTKGRTDTEQNINLLRKSILVSIDKLKNLKSILIYDVSIDDKMVNELFEPARKQNINVIVPDNLLKSRNIARSNHVQ